jgi:hypothetical protein
MGANPRHQHFLENRHFAGSHEVRWTKDDKVPAQRELNHLPSRKTDRDIHMAES